MIKFNKRVTINKDFIQSPNILDRFDEEDQAKMGQLCYDGYDRDLFSRKRWERRMEAAMDLAMQIQKDKNFPWPNCANVVFPLITIAALQFQSRSYSNIIQGPDVYQYRVTGTDVDGKLREKADRISRHMSWQVMEQDTAWEEQHDRLLINLAIVGCNFIKSYYSPSRGHNVSELVVARDFVIDYWAKSVEDAARKTQIIPLYRNEIYERVQQEIFANCLDDQWFQQDPSSEPVSQEADNRRGDTVPQPDEDTPFVMLEQHRLFDLDGDGYAEPYIATVEKTSRKILRLTPRFTENHVEHKMNLAALPIIRIIADEYFTKYSFIPAPDGGVYDLGFGILMGPVNEAVDSGINQMLDSGTMYNSNGGFLGRGAKIRGGVYTFPPWGWQRVDSTGDDLRKSIVPYETKEPSNVMFNLIQLLITYADRMSGAVDQMVGENPGQNTKVGTSNNTIEQGMKIYSQIFKRVWRSMKEEGKKLHRLNGQFMPPKQTFGSSQGFATQNDYLSDPDLVVPVADPNITSDAQRTNQAIMLKQAAGTTPGYDREYVEKLFLRAIRVDGIDRIFPGAAKTGPLPNPKMMVEQAKQQIAAAKLQWEQKKFLLELLSQKDKDAAEIELLRAQAAKLFADARLEATGQQIEQFQSIVDAIDKKNDAINDRVKLVSELLKGASDAQTDGGSKSGGDGGVATASSDGAVPGAAA